MTLKIKKAAVFAAALAVIFTLFAFPAFADDLVLLDDTAPLETLEAPDETGDTAAYDGGLADPDLPRVIDRAELLDDGEESSLAARIAGVTAEYGMDIVILTVNGTDGENIMDYADDFYDYSGDGGYGWGDDRDGLLLCVDMVGREMWISTCGRGIEVFTDYGIDLLLDDLVEDFGEGDHYAAFDRFVDNCEDFLGEAENGQPVDTWIPDDPDDYQGGNVVRGERRISPVPYIVSAVVGIVIALIVTGGMRSKMKTAVLRERADDYVRRDTFDLMAEEDVFLYSHTTSTPRNTDSGRSGGGGHYGGSSTHVSSSGTSHGGGGRSF